MSDGSTAAGALFTEASVRRLGPVRRFFVRRPVVMDVLVVLAFTLWALVTGLGADSMYVLHSYLGGEQVTQMQYASLALTVAGAVALFWRRRRPVAVAVVMVVLGVGALATTGATSGFEVGVALALYAVATSERPLLTWATFVGSSVALLVSARLLPLATTVGALMLGLRPAGTEALDLGGQQAPSVVFFRSAVWLQTAAPVLVLGLLAVAVGSSVRNRRLHVADLVDAANALARDQDQRARLVQAAERARIAREMHDVVAHSVSIMVALGGGASMALEWAPERSRAALDELVATGRAALADMRRVLGVLHGQDDAPESGAGAPPAWDDAQLTPLPGSLDLTALVDRSRAAGLPVSTTGLADTGLQELDASLQLAVYRIVQEALTNALRHAPGTPSVEVDVLRRPGTVEVVVTDRGPTVPVEPSPGSQRGLVGMRERAAVFGGTVDAGPYGEGWRIRALLPSHEGDT